jgi:hypothetical protein
MRNRVLALLGLLALGGSACAAQAADPGIYGVIDVSRYPKPQVINPRPALANHKVKSRSKPIYLHVPPGHEWHWIDHCQTYDACSLPVYFVTEGWFRSVYLPAIGTQDGREQRYRMQAARRDAAERDRYDAHPGE